MSAIALPSRQEVEDFLYREAALLDDSCRLPRKALRLDAATQANHSMWLALANYKNDEEVVPAPAPPVSAPAASAKNGTPH